MINKLIILAILATSPTALAQLKAVMVDESGVVQRPANFWSANSQASYNRHDVTFANLLVQTNDGGIANMTNSQLSISLQSTNATSRGAFRVMDIANGRPSAGVGTAWANDSHAFWIVMDCVARGTDVFRSVGGNDTAGTNIAAYPTQRAVGFEMGLAGESGGTGTNRVRLIAHNGTSSTNGPWVNVGTWFDRYTIGVLHNKSSGEVRLVVGVNSAPPALNTNATITGGPTNNGATSDSAWEIGMFSTQTNASAAGVSIYSAWLDVTD